MMSVAIERGADMRSVLETGQDLIMWWLCSNWAKLNFVSQNAFPWTFLIRVSHRDIFARNCRSYFCFLTRSNLRQAPICRLTSLA